jgi:hypothetical protein
MHHRTNAAPSARPRRASSATPSTNGASLHRTTTPVYQGLTPLETPARSEAPVFDWRAFALLLLAGAIAWLGWVAFTGPAPSASDEPATAAEVAR